MVRTQKPVDPVAEAAKESKRANAAAKIMSRVMSDRRLTAREMSMAISMLAAAMVMSFRREKEALFADPSLSEAELTDKWLTQLRTAIETDMGFLEERDRIRAEEKEAKKKKRR